MHSLRHAVAKLIISREMSYYAVANGREIGIFHTWDKCKEQVNGFKGAKYKKFPTRDEAEKYLMLNTDKKHNYNPLDNVIALGKQKNIDIKPENIEEYWPECDGDNFELPDSDLMIAMLEVEGLKGAETTSDRKRKATNSQSGTASKVPKHDSKIWEPVEVKKIGVHEFQIDCEGYVICYTDGSCFNNGRKNASAGFGVYFDDEHPLNAAKPVRGRVTNNAGEIQAAIHAIEVAKSHGIKKLCISTDSQFLINAITMWLYAWKRKNWRLKNGDPVKNVDDFKKLDALLSDNKLNVKWNYVKGHKGIKGNEMADELARKGTEMYKRMHSK